MTGVSYMIPFVTAGGILIALSFLIGGYQVESGTFAGYLNQVGGTAFGLMVPALAGFIAFSIADRPGIAPGMIAGMLASNIGAGFLGGLIGGLLAGFVALWIKKLAGAQVPFETDAGLNHPVNLFGDCRLINGRCDWFACQRNRGWLNQLAPGPLHR